MSTTLQLCTCSCLALRSANAFAAFEKKKRQGEIKEVISTLMHFDLKASVVPISGVNNPAWVGKAGAEAGISSSEDEGETLILGHEIDPSIWLELGFVWRNSSSKAGRVVPVPSEFVPPKTSRYRSSEGRGKH